MSARPQDRVALPLALALAACSGRPRIDDNPPRPPEAPAVPEGKLVPELQDPRETHLKNLRQLTFGGENAEAYWSFSGDQLIFQTTRPGFACDRIMKMSATGGTPTPVSNGDGRTTCSYFFPGDQEVIYASTMELGPDCPPPPDHSQGYVWALYDYDLYKARADGTGITKLFGVPGKYDAEATVCARDGSIIFTSDKDGDLELYRMNADGTDVVRLTDHPGYDGGAFFSSDCSKIVWRASRPTGAALADYKELLARHLVRPTKLEIWIADADGTNARQLTYLDTASFAPFFRTGGADRVLFASNVGDPKGRDFDIWAIDADGTDLERITYSAGFDGFPMFSPDGTKLAFSSNRGAPPPEPGKHGNSDTNVFVADWVAHPPREVTPIPADEIRRAVDYLASDALEGRGVGTNGLFEAQKWVEGELRQAGAEPALADGTYWQRFDVTTGLEIGATTGLTIDGTAVAASDVVPHAMSASGKVSAAVVDVGYGLVDAKLGLDDYKGKKVKGAIVVARRFTPASVPADARDRLGDLAAKAALARARGAKALVVFDDPPAGKDEAALPSTLATPVGQVGVGGSLTWAPPAPPPPSADPDLPPPPPPPPPAPPTGGPRYLVPHTGADAGLPIVVVRRAVATTLLAGKHKVALTVSLSRLKVETANIVGLVRAGGIKSGAEPIVVGAHLDHLGWGGPGTGSLEPTTGIHNGADDNASGVATLLEVTRRLVAAKGKLTRDVYVVAFSGEEMGILGSTWFVAHPPYAGTPRAMLNMDMVGRLGGDTLQVLGANSATEWPALIEAVCTAAGLHCSATGSGYGPSDHMAYYVGGAPVLHFFTGPHPDYHKASDDAAKINAGGAAQVARVVADLALAAAAAPALTYQLEKAPSGGGDVRIAGASLGTIPEYSDDGKVPGMLLSAVVGGGAADKAGLKRGDRITRLGKDEIRNVQDLMRVLGTATPGTEVEVEYLRDGKKQTVKATYGVPRARH